MSARRGSARKNRRLTLLGVALRARQDLTAGLAGAVADRQIDRLVYELYGLTDEEIGIVEGG